MIFCNLRHRIFYAVHDFLNIGQSPERTDCIFVFAGRPERKLYALDLFKRGYANRIVFSVSRYEWRHFLQLGLEQDGGLAELVQKTPPALRHFFVYIDHQRAWCSLIDQGKYGTLSEVRALIHLAQRQNIKRLMVVSSDFHLRRICETLRRYRVSGDRLSIIPVAVPEELASEARTNWWASPAVATLIAKEYVKYISYKFFVSFDLFRLKHERAQSRLFQNTRGHTSPADGHAEYPSNALDVQSLHE